MALEEADILSVVLEFVDSLEGGGASPSSEEVAQHVVVQGGAECRAVCRSWRITVEKTIGRALPPMTPVSLTALLVPGRLRGVLLSCQYLGREFHEHAAAAAFVALVSRAEAVALRLRAAAAAIVSAGAGAAAAPRGVPSQGVMAEEAAGGEGIIINNSNNNTSFVCYRVALKRIVGEALDSPAFSWCSTLGLDDSRLLESCVGASTLVNARWFG
ncbi:unnamed protein product [Ectocarpus fasciculatus]